MPYKVRHYPSLEIAEITLSGAISASDIRESTSEFVQLQRKTGRKSSARIARPPSTG